MHERRVDHSCGNSAQTTDLHLFYLNMDMGYLSAIKFNSQAFPFFGKHYPNSNIQQKGCFEFSLLVDEGMWSQTCRT